jgi:hypothetical protein
MKPIKISPHNPRKKIPVGPFAATTWMHKADIAALIADRVIRCGRKTGDDWRTVLDRVNHAVDYAVKNKPFLAANAEGQLQLGAVMAWASSKRNWIGLFDDFPKIHCGTLVMTSNFVSSIAAEVCIDGDVLPDDIESAHKLIRSLKAAQSLTDTHLNAKNVEKKRKADL